MSTGKARAAGRDPDSGRRVRSVSEITRDIKLNLEGAFTNLWIAGEISNLKQHTSGHYYFTLKDDRAQLLAVLFRASTRFLRFRPQDGMAVLVWGHITVYEPKGSYQIRVERMEPRGQGSLALAFEQLKEKLGKEGLFEASRKKRLPLLPRRIGIVTSPTGAAIRDICRILHRRFPNLGVLVYPAQVQGDLAAAEVAKGIQVLNRLGGFDVLIVTRGGGSLEDLWPFNEESVARAIAASTIPVVSAVGHETDFTIADFVADVRAPTPSAAAEMVISRKEDFQERLSGLTGRLSRSVSHRIAGLRGRVDRIAAHQAFAAVLHGIETKGQRVDEASYRARSFLERRASRLRARIQEQLARLGEQRVDRRLGDARARLVRLAARIEARARARVELERRSFASVVSKLEALSPLDVLGRGYSLAWSAQGKLLRSSGDVAPGDRVRVDLHRGRLHCRVEEVERGERDDGPEGR
jgi:exodeoxyribonuclease VII large subunit